MRGESPLPGSYTANLSLGPHLAGGARELSEVSYKDTNPIHEGPTLMT